MFDIGWTEIALIGGVAVVVMGPEEMPRALYNFGKVVRKIKTFTNDIQKSLDKIVNEVEVEDLARDINTTIGGPNLQFEIDRQVAEEERRMAEAEEEAVAAPKKKPKNKSADV